MIRLILIFMISLFSFNVSALEVKSLKIICERNNSCSRIEDTFKSLRREYSDLEHFHNVIKLYVSNEGVKTLTYELVKTKRGHRLEIYVSTKPQILEIGDISFVGDHKIDLPTIIPIKKDEYLDRRKIAQSIFLFKEIAKDKGYPDVKVAAKVETKKNGVVVSFKIDLGDPIIINKITVSSKSLFLKNILENVLGEYVGSSYDLPQVKAEIEQLRKLFIQYGFYLTEIDLKEVNFADKNKLNRKRKKVSLIINIKNTKSYSFYFKGLTRIKENELKRFVSESMVSLKREMNSDNVEQAVKEYALSLGLTNISIKVLKKEKKYRIEKFTKDYQDHLKGEKQTLKGANTNSKLKWVSTSNKLNWLSDQELETGVSYEVDVNENDVTKISDIFFKGNRFFEDQELKDHFFENGNELISAETFDEKFLNEYINKLKEKYIQEGFLSVFVEDPVIGKDKKTNKILVTYRIREGIRTQISTLRFKGLKGPLIQELRARIENKEKKYFNPISFQQDLDKITEYLKSEGYYFAKIKNANLSNLVKYKDDNSQVDLFLDIETGLKLYTDEIIIIGNAKTRKVLIRREVELKKGELITSEKIENSQAALLGLGIFNSVQIKPVSNNKQKTDVLIFVKEKDFGLIEFAPGIRTDLGLKVSTTINYNNLDGMNKRITFKGSVNKRLDLNSLDETRRDESRSLIEYDAAVNYSENHIFGSDFDFSSSASKSRKRFFSFDADIQRIGFAVSRDITDWFNVSTRYQLETISQFDATLDRDQGHFQIGSITPAMTFDFRNRSINPTSGALFNFSCEFANPSFLSQENDELTIDYYKLINRNKFYVPFSRDVILAVSTAFGIQENLATAKNSDGTTEGYIPNIKVFRLSGADIIRGFEDDEANRLINNLDISEVEVNSRAYMANIKIEPRLFLTDSTMLGVFYDAGRIFVDEFKADELRSSVGLSFKYLTPVGSLDFDYGIKLLRNKDADGTLDSPGRLHVSIGFF